MPGETDLDAILGALTVSVRPGTFVYVGAESAPDLEDVEAMVREREGAGYVLAASVADRLRVDPEPSFAWLTIDVETSLEGVGLTAVLSTALADAGIACNVIAGLRHAHLLVPADRVDDAMDALTALRTP